MLPWRGFVIVRQVFGYFGGWRYDGVKGEVGWGGRGGGDKRWKRCRGVGRWVAVERGKLAVGTDRHQSLEQSADQRQ